MKSSIKVDYAGLHDSLDTENKKPIIRIDLQESDDPRDTLLNDLVTPTTVFGFMLKKETTVCKTYVLYAQNRHEQICRVSENAYNVFKHIYKNSSFALATSHDEIYFFIIDTPIRSKGIKRNDATFLQDDEVNKLLTEDFLTFQEQTKIVAH